MNRAFRYGGSFKVCPSCGSNLDPGERCECEEKPGEAATSTPATAKIYNNSISKEEAFVNGAGQ